MFSPAARPRRQAQARCPGRFKQRVIKKGFKPYVKDNRRTWDMNADSHYPRKKPRGTLPRSTQLMLLGELGQE